MKFKRTIKNVFRKLGYDIISTKSGLNYGTKALELLKILREVNTDLILDIGANKGQFGKELYSYGYQQKILSFEPLSSVYKDLKDTASYHPQWYVYNRCCVGDSEKEVTMHQSNLIGNSSTLSIKETKYNVQGSNYINEEIVEQISLASLNEHVLLKASNNIFIKLDIQGSEHFVLSRVKDTTFNIVGFYIELSLVKLYEKQEDYLYICQQLKQLGYDLVYITYESIRSGRMIQFNGVFLHHSLSYN